MIYKIAPENAGRYWLDAWAHLSRIDGLDLDHARDLCVSGDWALWLAVVDGEVIAAMLTEVAREPDVVITIVNAAGRDIDVWERPFLDRVDEWAAHLGAARLRVIGRKGWLRRLAGRGFREKSVIMEMEYGQADEKQVDPEN